MSDEDVCHACPSDSCDPQELLRQSDDDLDRPSKEGEDHSVEYRRSQLLHISDSLFKPHRADRLVAHTELGGQFPQCSAGRVRPNGGLLACGQLAPAGCLIRCPLRLSTQATRRDGCDVDGSVPREHDGVATPIPIESAISTLTGIEAVLRIAVLIRREGTRIARNRLLPLSIGGDFIHNALRLSATGFGVTAGREKVSPFVSSLWRSDGRLGKIQGRKHLFSQQSCGLEVGPGVYDEVPQSGVDQAPEVPDCVLWRPDDHFYLNVTASEVYEKILSIGFRAIITYTSDLLLGESKHQK